MCGIAGIVAARPVRAATIRGMTDVVRHRGPDDEGFVLFQAGRSEPMILGGTDTPDAAFAAALAYAPRGQIGSWQHLDVAVALGHRRLSIVDLSPAGHQPMCSPTGRLWIVYNGEVYNHLELRSELERRGHAFVSRSDTEVILAAFAEWGIACLSRLNGMWAVAIYDTAANELFLARDRFGVKPLYYWISPTGVLAFASEIKQFVDLPGWNPTANARPTYDFLVHGISDHTRETLFSGVYQIEPGHYARVAVDTCDRLEAGRPIPTKQWYCLRPRGFTGSFGEAATEFRRLFQSAVELRLRADVPLGSCLSGGLDSSSIVCLVNRLLRERDAQSFQRVVSACSNVERFDERKWIDVVVRATGVEAHYVYPRLQELFDQSSAIAWHQDEPYGSTSIYAQWSVFRKAAERGVKVMLDGQGSDEQLAGYHSFFGPRLAIMLTTMHWRAMLGEIRAIHRMHGQSFGAIASSTLPWILPPNAIGFLRRLHRRSTAVPNWLNVQRLCTSPGNIEQGRWMSRGSLADVSVWQLTRSSLPMLLHWEDRDSMAHSIESRVPFLDYRLVEFTLGLPADFKLAGGVTKRVLREGMRHVLPDVIRERIDKLGFVTAEETWLRETAPDLFRAEIERATEAAGGIVKRREALQLLEEMISGRRRFSFLPWRLISFGQWIQKFAVAV